jgi:hypothetical protein
MLTNARCDQLIHALQKRASASAVIMILLGLAVFVAFWNRNSWAGYLFGGPPGFWTHEA